VVVAVVIFGVVVALVLAIGLRDGFCEERVGLWMFHGEADTSPHQMPGAQFQERHVIDPEAAGETSERSAIRLPRPDRHRSSAQASNSIPRSERATRR